MKLKFWLTTLICVYIFFSCKNKKTPSLSGDEPIDVEDFIGSFQQVNLPFQVTDTSINKKTKDSLLISYNVFTQFVPDSILRKVFPKDNNPKIYPLGRVIEPGKGNYLFAKALNGDRKAVYILGFDKKDNFIAGMPVLYPDADPATKQQFIFDKRYALSKLVSRKNKDGSTSDGKDVFILNEPAKTFLLIMTDALDVTNQELINPIDTVSKKNKYSGDYLKDKKNLVSIRDNKRPGRITFFVHFEKNNGKCTGELKGEAGFTSPNVAVYRAAGEQCEIQFNFTAASVTMKEIRACGSHRGVDCVFEGNFPKKKEATPKPKKPVKK